MGKIPGGEKAVIQLVINEDGMIIGAQEIDVQDKKGKELEYHDKETKKIADGDDAIFSTNPCRWVKINGRWVCV